MNNINPKQLKEMLEKHEVVMIDVREPIEYEHEHIEGAVSIPLGKLDKLKLPLNINNKKIVLYCRVGNRSKKAYEKLKSDNLQYDLFNLEGGIASWKTDGLTKPKCNFIPLERQVHAIVGSTVLIASILAYFINIKFVLLSGFFGIGLSVSGFTGFCGLALLLAKAPWNRRFSAKPSYK